MNVYLKEMLVMSKYDLWVINMDCCPDDDVVIMQGHCTGCHYYRGFQVENGQPCIVCSFRENANNKEQD